LNETTSKNFEIDCPVICAEDLNKWMISICVFIGLTVLAIIFMSVYTVILKLKYRKVYEKMKQSSVKM
jgi:hypothetical protein